MATRSRGPGLGIAERLPRERRPRPDPTPEPFPTTQQVTEVLAQLTEQVGSNRIQDLRLEPRQISATMLTDQDRSVRFTRSADDPWDNGKEADPLEYPVSLWLDQLPLHPLPEFVAHAGPEAMSLSLSVDVTGRLRILAYVRGVPVRSVSRSTAAVGCHLLTSSPA